jgi:hypothetical protein
MKQSNTYSNQDQNWQWPEKTWFRERLNAVKARENEQRRKPLVTNRVTHQASNAVDADKDQLKAD